jgi:hypothetical protein
VPAINLQAKCPAPCTFRTRPRGVAGRPDRAQACAVGAFVAVGCFAGVLARSDEHDQNPDNGTDPTRQSRSITTSLEHLDLGGGISQNTFKAQYSTPITSDARTAIRLTVPLVQNDVFGHEGYSLSDVGVKITDVVKITRQYGLVIAGEFTFDTANQIEGGTGKNVFKGTFTYAKFLQGGSIFAPSLNQSNSIWGDKDRASVNNTVLDFYFVPKLKDPKTYVTVDPAINSNWETKAKFPSLAITIGRALGPAFGGHSQIYLKPETFAGGDRSANWGVEFGYKVIGF